MTEDARRLAVASLVVLTVIAAVAAAKVASAIVAPTVLAGLFALTLAPLVAALEKRRVPCTIAAGAVVAFCTLAIAGGAYLLAPSAEEWRLRAPSVIRSLERHLRDIEREIKNEVDQATAGKADDVAGTESAADAVLESGQRLMTDMMLAAPEILATLLYIVLLCFFLLAERAPMRRFMVSLAPTPRTRLNLSRAFRDIRQNIARYLLIISVDNVLLGAASAMAFWLLGLPNPALWGALVAILNYMPYLGPLTANALVFLVGMTTFYSVPEALYPVLALAALNLVEGQLMTPMAVGRQVRVGPLSVFLALAVGAWLWGIVGALVATPVLIVGESLTRRLMMQPPRPQKRDGEPGRRRTEDLAFG